MSQFTQGHAVVIGVGGDLSGTAEDARGIADILKDQTRCAYPPKQVHLLTAAAATRHAILDTLAVLAKQTSGDATLVIYFSGHGYEVSHKYGRDYFLLPHGYDTDNLRDTAVSGTELQAALAAIPRQKLLLLLDCCHAAGIPLPKGPDAQFAKAPFPASAPEQLAQGAGNVLIASSQANEKSVTGDPYSAFTLALVEGLTGSGISQQDGFVRVADLAMYTGRTVPAHTYERQHPVLHFSKADNFAVAYYAGGAIQPKGLTLPRQPIIHTETADSTGKQMSATASDGSTIVQGDDNVVLGPGAVYVPRGNVGGHIITGSHITVVTDSGSGSRRAGGASRLPETYRGMGKKIRSWFNLTEIRMMCFDLGVEYEDLPGNTLSEKASGLVDYCYRAGLMPQLIDYCRTERPHVTWP